MKLKTLASSAIGVAILDQLTKTLLTQKQYYILGVKLIDYTENTGAAFSILPGYRWLLITVSLLAIISIMYYTKTLDEKQKKQILILGILAGGIIGNLIDRILLGYVRDFINIQIWPVFNLADTAVFISVTYLLIYMVKEKLNKTTYH